MSSEDSEDDDDRDAQLLRQLRTAQRVNDGADASRVHTLRSAPLMPAFPPVADCVRVSSPDTVEPLTLLLSATEAPLPPLAPDRPPPPLPPLPTADTEMPDAPAAVSLPVALTTTVAPLPEDRPAPAALPPSRLRCTKSC